MAAAVVTAPTLSRVISPFPVPLSERPFTVSTPVLSISISPDVELEAIRPDTCVLSGWAALMPMPAVPLAVRLLPVITPRPNTEPLPDVNDIAPVQAVIAPPIAIFLEDTNVTLPAAVIGP